MKNHIKAIIFDWGGVFTNAGNFDPFYEYFCNKYNLKREIINNETKNAWDLGRIGDAEADKIWKVLSNYSGEGSDKIMKKCIEIDGFNDDVYEVAKELKNDYKLGMITNIIESWFEEVRKKYKLDSLFDVIVTSYESGSFKPQEDIYRLAVEKLEVLPEECIFIDDVKKNIIAAEKIGMNGILFRDVRNLKKNLENF